MLYLRLHLPLPHLLRAITTNADTTRSQWNVKEVQGEAGDTSQKSNRHHDCSDACMETEPLPRRHISRTKLPGEASLLSEGTVPMTSCISLTLTNGRLLTNTYQSNRFHVQKSNVVRNKAETQPSRLPSAAILRENATAFAHQMERPCDRRH